VGLMGFWRVNKEKVGGERDRECGRAREICMW
jgi:hypothetical protein